MRIEEKEYTKSIDISIWKKVFPFLAPRKNVLIMVIVMNILCSVVDIIMPLFHPFRKPKYRQIEGKSKKRRFCFCKRLFKFTLISAN